MNEKEVPLNQIILLFEFCLDETANQSATTVADGFLLFFAVYLLLLR